MINPQEKIISLLKLEAQKQTLLGQLGLKFCKEVETVGDFLERMIRSCESCRKENRDEESCRKMSDLQVLTSMYQVTGYIEKLVFMPRHKMVVVVATTGKSCHDHPGVISVLRFLIVTKQLTCQVEGF